MQLGMKIKPAEKLAILQANDHFRNWQTLDDERVCVLCDRKFTGHEILISAPGEMFELHCPTPLFATATQFYHAGVAQGRGGHDTGAICAVLEQLAGITPRG